MLTENDVVEAVAQHLHEDGYSITSLCATTQCGDDIVAVKGYETIFVEAKGATSSKAGTHNYGEPFDPSQVRVHVATAIHKALKRNLDGTGAIALPDDAAHDREINTVVEQLKRLGIRIFRVSSLRNVREE